MSKIKSRRRKNNMPKLVPVLLIAAAVCIVCIICYKFVPPFRSAVNVVNAALHGESAAGKTGGADGTGASGGTDMSGEGTGNAGAVNGTGTDSAEDLNGQEHAIIITEGPDIDADGADSAGTSNSGNPAGPWDRKLAEDPFDLKNFNLAAFSVPEDNIDTTDCGYSLDADDYADTGGTAQGSLYVDPAVPEGCIPLGNVSLSGDDEIVGTPQMYTYEELESDLEELSSQYEDIMHYESLGKTPDGREFYIAIAGDGRAEHCILITASIHAREYLTSNLVMKQLEYILAAYDQNAAVGGVSMRDWLKSTAFVFAPMCNPDGVSISQYGLEGVRSDELKAAVNAAYAADKARGTADGSLDRYLRRWKANANGVNLNENFALFWDRIGVKAASPSSGSYKGAAPCSEPETKYMTMLADVRHYDAAIHYHSMGNIIYWDIANNKVREHSRELANNIMLLTGYPEKISDDGASYKDYCQLKEDPIPSVTIEVGSTEAPVDPKEMPSIWAKNRFVPFYAMMLYQTGV